MALPWLAAIREVTLFNMTSNSRLVWILAALGGALITWSGGFMLASSNGTCVDGPTIHECSGTFASDAWHAVGIVLIVAGAIIVLGAAVKAIRTTRGSGSLAPE
jgi:hypothetical protein